MKTKLIISGLAFLAITTLASGQNNIASSQPQNSTGRGIAYVDANNNGICDNFENRVTNASSCKGYGNFNCCGQGQRQGRGQKGWCRGQGQGQGQGQSRGRNFVDANKNGICDYNEISDKK